MSDVTLFVWPLRRTKRVAGLWQGNLIRNCNGGCAYANGFTPSSHRDEITRAPTALSPDMSAVVEHGFNVQPRVHLQGTTILPLKPWTQQRKQGGWSGGEKGMETSLLLSLSTRISPPALASSFLSDPHSAVCCCFAVLPAFRNLLLCLTASFRFPSF